MHLREVRDSRSASMFSGQGIRATVSQICLLMHKSHILLARLFNCGEWLVPILLIVVCAVVLNTITLTCLPENISL